MFECRSTNSFIYDQGCHGQGKSLENEIFSKSGNLGLSQGNLKEVQVREKSGNFKIFSKVMVFGNVSMS